MIRRFIRRILAEHQQIYLIFRIIKLRFDLFRNYILYFGLFRAYYNYSKIRSKKGGLQSLIPANLKHPVYIRLGTSDVSVFEKIFVWREYFISNLYSPIKQILDCGANTGLSAIWFATQFPTAKVIAVEPDSKNFDLLCKNIAPYSNIIPLRAAIWSTSCHVKLENPDDRPDSFQFCRCSSDYPNSIKAIDIATLCNTYEFTNIDLLKIDIEGGEREVFSVGCDDWLAQTQILLIEFHGEDCRKTVTQRISNFTWNHHIQGENDCFVRK